MFGRFSEERTLLWESALSFAAPFSGTSTSHSSSRTPGNLSCKNHSSFLRVVMIGAGKIRYQGQTGPGSSPEMGHLLLPWHDPRPHPRNGPTLMALQCTRGANPLSFQPGLFLFSFLERLRYNIALSHYSGSPPLHLLTGISTIITNYETVYGV